MKKYLLIATALVALASCSDDTFVGENSPNTNDTYGGEIKFGLSMQKQTRADIGGKAAADLLGNNFYVTGTKGTEATHYPTPTVVFDNYLVHYGENTAGTTQSNTANWEYVGIDQGASPKAPEDYNRVKISSIKGAQTIKYWDYNAKQYDFFGFSTGTKHAVKKTTFSGEGSLSDSEIGVTAMLYGSGLNVESTIPTAYTFYIPTLEGLQNTYITDITEVAPANYGKEVQLRFKNLGSKIRVALYETVPGYSVKNVKFYQADAGASPSDLGSTVDNANLIGANNLSFPTKGTINVRFQHVGTTYEPGATNEKEDYNKADAQVTPVDITYNKYKDFGALTTDQLVLSERDEVKWDESTSKYVAETGKVFLGRTLPTASFAGSTVEQFYQTVFPNTSGYPVTLRVDYTLVPIDGAAETITVKGAKAVVPATYTKWLPNYAYTYIFKISDNTNGWTGTASQPSGLFPITFDAVVAEATDATGEQKTITTVATPSITTYQQGHDNTKDEYSKSSPADKDIYVQVMDNELTSPVLVGTTVGSSTSTKPLLDATTPFIRSLLYAVTSGKTYSSQPADWPKGYYTDAVCNTEASGTFSSSTTYYKRCTEADVMDALENQASVDGSDNITGRNDVILTKNVNIHPDVTSIINGVDDNPITVTKGTAAQIDISALAAGTYAYVYDYSSSKTETIIYQPITATGTLADGTIYVTKSTLDGINTETSGNVTTEGEAVSSSYLYFSKTTNGSSVTTYSFISVDGKKNLPAGLVKCPVGSLSTSTGSTDASAALFVFTTYKRNDGKYAVKVIKVVD